MSDALRPETMVRAGYSLITNVVITSVLGLAFWITAARLLPSATVGRDAVLVSAMISISVVCQLNLTAIVLRFLPVARMAPRRFVGLSYAVVGGLSLVAGSAFVIAAPSLSSHFGFLENAPWLAATFVTGVVALGIFSLQDAVLTAFRRASWVPLENAIFGALKIALLAALVVAGADHALFVAWILGMALLIVPINALILRSVIPKRPPRGDVRSPVERFGRRGLARFLLQDLGGTLFGHASSTLLPVLVVVLVGAVDSAYFYMPFSLILAFDLMFLNVAAALTTAGATDEQRLGELTRLAVRRFGPLLLAGVAVTLAGAPLLLGLYGGAYAEEGTTVLRLLACASLFRAVTALYSGVCRVRGRGLRILALHGGGFVWVMALTIVLAPGHGIEGVAMAWVVASGMVALAAAPGLVDLLRRRSDATQHDTERAVPCAVSA